MDIFFRGLDYIRWSLITALADIAFLTAMLILAALISPLAVYLFAMLIYYVVPISSIIPYAIVAMLWVSGFRSLWVFNRRYSLGLMGSVLLVVSYFINAGYVGYVLFNVLMGRVPIPHVLVGNGLILYRSRLLLILSLYLPLPMLVAVIAGLVGAVMSLVTLYSLGRDYNEGSTKLGSLISLVGSLLLVNAPLFGGPLLIVGMSMLIMGLGRLMSKFEGDD